MQDPRPVSEWMTRTQSAFRDPVRDQRSPASYSRLNVLADGARLPVRLWQAAGPEPKGTVIISPPMGGSEVMNHVIVPLTCAGINVLSFRPAGVRDPAIRYRMPNNVVGIHAMIDWIVANAGAGKTLPSGQPLRLDASHIAAFGLSGGGGAASYVACAESKHCHYAIGSATENVSEGFDRVDEFKPMLDAIKAASHGTHDYYAWVKELSPAEIKHLSIVPHVPKLVDKHILLFGSSHDTMSPVDVGNMPTVRAMRAAGAKDFHHFILETDHRSSTKRHTFARLMVSWLLSQGF